MVTVYSSVSSSRSAQVIAPSTRLIARFQGSVKEFSRESGYMRVDTNPGSPSELPFGWVAQHDAASGRAYWLHVPTDRIAYRRPRRPLPPEPISTSDDVRTTTPTSPSSNLTASPRLPSSPRQSRPSSSVSLPGISDTLNAYRPSLQTRVDSSSSLSSSGSAALRSPPPPYEVGSSRSNNGASPPPLVPLQSPRSPAQQSIRSNHQIEQRLATPRSTPVAGPSSELHHEESSRGRTPGPGASMSTSIASSLRSPAAQSTSISHLSSRIVPRNALGLDPNPTGNLPPSTPSAPILSNATTPATAFLPGPSNTSMRSPQWNPLSPLPPLPPIPPELRADRNALSSTARGTAPGRSASTEVPRHSTYPHAPGRSNSEPIPGHSLTAQSSPFLAVPVSPRRPSSSFQPHQASNRTMPAYNSLPLPGSALNGQPPMSPSARSDRSFASGTTVALDPYFTQQGTSMPQSAHKTTGSGPASDIPAPQTSAGRAGTSGNDGQLDSGSKEAGSLSGIHERTRRPYIVSTPTVIPSPGPSVLRTRVDPRSTPRATSIDPADVARPTESRPPPRDLYNTSPEPSAPPRRASCRHTGLTPDIEEMSNFPSSPVSPRRASRAESPSSDDYTFPSRCNTYPGTPYHRPVNDHGWDDPFNAGSAQSPSDDSGSPDVRPRIHMFRRGAPSTLPALSDASERLAKASRDAERFASELSKNLHTSTARSQQLLNEIYKLKLQKAQQKIDALQEKLVDIGHRDAQLERELKKEEDEIRDWEIARLDEGIMRDLGSISEAEYAQLKRELDREMTLDELRERLSQYEPLHYDYDPFDPHGLYAPLPSLPKHRRRARPGRNGSPYPEALDYSSDCDCDYSSYSGRLHSYDPAGDYDGMTGHTGCRHHRNTPRHEKYDPVRQPYSHAQQETMNRAAGRPRRPSSVFHNEGNTWSFMGDHDTSGYSSADEQMFGTPRMSPHLARRRSTTSMMPRPILRRGGYDLHSSRPRSRKVSFEDELGLGDEGVSMFRTTPGFLSTRY